jgi:hypothetical protein
MKLFDDIEKIVSKGKERTEADRDDSISKTQKIKGIKENQKKERELQRELSRAERGEVDIEYQQAFVSEQEYDDELDLFRSLQDWEDTDE